MGKILKPYVVRQGDNLTCLAFRRGFDAETVWNDPKNDDIRAMREDMDVLYPGDLLFLPDSAAASVSLSAQTGNNYGANVPKITLRIAFEDDDGAYAGEDFVVVGVDPPLELTTDGEGVAVFEIPYTTKSPKVIFPARKEAYVVDVGHLDPVTTKSGVQQRLRLLGWLPHPTTAVTSDALAKTVAHYEMSEALKQFQEASGVTPTGEIDKPTRDALVAAFGS